MGAELRVRPKELGCVKSVLMKRITIFVRSWKWSLRAPMSSWVLSKGKNLFKLWNIVPIITRNNTRQGYIFGSLVRIESNLKLAGYLFLVPLKPRFICNNLGLS